MQHLKVSGAVRPLKWSLGVKGLKTPLNFIYRIKHHEFKGQMKILEMFYTKLIEKNFTDKLQGNAQANTRKDRILGL